MGNQKYYLLPKSAPKASLIVSHLQLNHFFYFLFFIFGLSVGIIAGLYHQTFPFADSSGVSFYSEPLLKVLSSNKSTVNSRGSERVKTMNHNMSDEELIKRATEIEELRYDDDLHVRPRVAFMFLIRNDLPLAPFWERFFKGHEDYYSIYVHADPSSNDTASPDSVFYGRRIPSQAVEWGTISMVDGERRLLGTALLEPSNHRFVLASESCIPVFNFNTIYSHFVNSNLSFLGLFDELGEVGRGRYSPAMSPTVELHQWRKGSQWFELTRKLASHVVSDTVFYPVFRDHCRGGCYSDEHYFPTMVHVLYPGMSANRSTTWVDWSGGGAHPREFPPEEVTDEFLNRVRFGSGRCEYGGVDTSVCFLFARKFGVEALEPLLRVAPLLLGFNP